MRTFNKFHQITAALVALIILGTAGIVTLRGNGTTHRPLVNGPTAREIIDINTDPWSNPIVTVQGNTLLDASTGTYIAPMICAHQSVVTWDDDSCLAEANSGKCMTDAHWWVIAQHHYLCAEVTENAHVVANFKNTSLNACDDETHPDYGSYACWANLNGEARINQLTHRRKDGVYVLKFSVNSGGITPVTH